MTNVQALGLVAQKIDDYFYHRVPRRVKKDGTVSWEGNLFEVDYTLAGKTINLVVEPHEKLVINAESLDGQWLSDAHPLDCHANLRRRRHRPTPANQTANKGEKTSVVEIAHQRQQQQLCLDNTVQSTEIEV